MKRRIWLWVLVGAVFVVLISYAAMRDSAVAAGLPVDCTQGSASVQNGCQIYHAVGNYGHSCANCHGEPGYCSPYIHPWDQHGTCDQTATIGKTISLLGASKATLTSLASLHDTNAYMTLWQSDFMTVIAEAQAVAPECIVYDPNRLGKCATAALFLESGVTSDNAFNNLAAYLAWADPVPCPIKSPTTVAPVTTSLSPTVHCIATYEFSGTIYGGAKLLPKLLTINITSDYNPVSPQISTVQNGDDVHYSASGLLAGDYTVTPGTFPYLHFPPSCTVTMNYEFKFARNPCPLTSADFTVGRFVILRDPLALGQEVSSLAQQEGPSLAERIRLDGIMNTVNVQLAEGEVQGATSSLQEFVRLTDSFVRQELLPEAVGRRLIDEANAIIAHLRDRKPED